MQCFREEHDSQFSINIDMKGDSGVSFTWKYLLLCVGVSRGYTDYHQGRAIHMADSRIH